MASIPKAGKATMEACAIWAAIAAIALVVLAFIPRPAFEFEHFDVLSGRQALSDVATADYLRYLRANLTVDSFYILGFIMTWIGYGRLIAHRSRLMGVAVAASGVIAGSLDFLENEFRWGMAELVRRGIPVSSAWPAAWSVILGLSFWAVFFPLALTVIGTWDDGKFGRWVSVLGILGLLTAVNLRYSGFFWAFIWLMLWQLASAAFLWVRREV